MGRRLPTRDKYFTDIIAEPNSSTPPIQNPLCLFRRVDIEWMASHSRPAVLEPASSTLLNELKGSSPQSWKRRKLSHESDITKNTFCSAFTIRPHGSSQLSETHLILAPLALIPRSRLPLSWLDPCPRSSQRIQSGRLFVANIPTLEQDLQQQQQQRQEQRRHEPVVLAARLVGSEGAALRSRVARNAGVREEFYVVERVKRGIYAVCALGSWVVEGDLMVAAEGFQNENGLSSCAFLQGSKEEDIVDDKGEWDWLEKAKIFDPVDSGVWVKRKAAKVSLAFESEPCKKKSVPTLSPETSGVSSISELASTYDEQLDLRDISVVEADAQHSSQLADPLLTLGTATPIDLQAPEAGFPSCESAEPKVNQSPRELLDILRSKYLEALYISKTSVAYFAKGPLSRARALFQSSSKESSLKPIYLSSFYRECILPVKKVDIKYKDSLPEAIQNIPIGMSDDEGPVNTTTLRKRKGKKAKIGKNGLYPEETDFIMKWWKNRSFSEASVPRKSSRQEEMKRLIGDLRMRETQLQVLLILETIYLEASAGKSCLGLSSTETQVIQATKRTKEEKQQDLNVLLELLVDRLCIWHAVSFGDLLHTESASSTGNNETTGKSAENDKLRDFCTEVIIPFYAGRLPDQCKAISRKLGGPVAISPSRPVAISHPKSGRTAQPGASVKRTRSQRSQQRTLQRVLTDEKLASKSRAPSLSRSSSGPSIPGLKREVSEPPLLSLISGARGGIQKPKRVDNREVDLDAVAKQHEMKLKKMNSLLDQKRELDAAIVALRKPNRELVAKEFVETAEKRVSTGSSRKSKNPVRIPNGQGVQVMATPKGLKKRDCINGGDNLMRMPRGLTSSNEKPTPSLALSNDIQVIPSSSSRPSHLSERQPLSSRRAPQDSVHETPTRMASRPSRLSNGGIADNDFDSTPVPKQSSILFKVPKLPETKRSFAPAETSPIVLRKTKSFPNLVHSGNDYDYDNNNNDHYNKNPSVPMNTPASLIQETPPRPRSSYLPPSLNKTPAFARYHNRQQQPIIFTTPIKIRSGTGSKPTFSGTQHDSCLNPTAKMNHFTVDATPEKSIYDQLGWNDEDDDL
ncbi:hypothetical protein PAAG_02900 [Paracoccidioides lutzii Pb01]|uniref:DNA replication regulator Sld3 C-terminal domain-containing protein n=1 Tax=Paracoccidioides lutzii (strain ATCC MYA-826 / Pb01) TaxID=502779 RepID=C1GWK5_PARBA|nr:hypothetical protein PAAG_02900 [Paracoccidioides lutzii Pb01]EEH40924.2 hypothetical protein PAAG_02900 [Paracoccidioides lutzii Pb01]